MSKTVIITGINGQLGQFMAKYLLENEKNIKIIGTIRHKSYDEQPYIFDRSKIKLELMDLSDAHSIEGIILKYKPDYFINTAANAFVGESWSVPAQHIEINTLAVLHQLEAIRKHSPLTRYFNMGTSEEFGATEKGILNEKSLLSPRSPYGASKCAARHIVKVWRESYGLYALQGWTFNFESELRGEKYVTKKIAKGVARIVKAIKNGQNFEPLELGNVDSFRSWQFAEDVASGIWKMLNQELYNKNISLDAYQSQQEQNRSLSTQIKEYVLSAPDTHKVREFVAKAFAYAGIDGIWISNGKPEDETFIMLVRNDVNEFVDQKNLVVINPKFYRPADVTYLHGDSSEITKDLGWNITLGFDDLLKRMVSYELKEINYVKKD